MENLDHNKIKSLVINELKSSFKPEFLNRIDETIVFNPLNKKVISKIVEIEIEEVNNLLIPKNIHLNLSTYALEYLTNKGFEPQYGARPIKRLIKKEILNALSKELLNNNFKSGDNILVDSFDEAIIFLKNSNLTTNEKIKEFSEQN